MDYSKIKPGDYVSVSEDPYMWGDEYVEDELFSVSSVENDCVYALIPGKQRFIERYAYRFGHDEVTHHVTKEDYDYINEQHSMLDEINENLRKLGDGGIIYNKVDELRETLSKLVGDDYQIIISKDEYKITGGEK